MEKVETIKKVGGGFYRHLWEEKPVKGVKLLDYAPLQRKIDAVSL